MSGVLFSLVAAALTHVQIIGVVVWCPKASVHIRSKSHANKGIIELFYKYLSYRRYVDNFSKKTMNQKIPQSVDHKKRKIQDPIHASKFHPTYLWVGVFFKFQISYVTQEET